MTDWRNRIIGHGEQPADQFTANPRNPRRHPQKQRDAVAGSLATLGWIAPVIVNKRTGYVIDGHERIWQAMAQDNADVPYVEVDLSEDEEALALATFDWITYLAEYDRDILDDLLREVNTDNVALQEVITQLATLQGVIPPDDPYAEWQGMPEFEQGNIDAALSIIVHFPTFQDAKAFAKVIGCEVTEATKSIWYPMRPDRPHAHEKYIEED